VGGFHDTHSDGPRHLYAAFRADRVGSARRDVTGPSANAGNLRPVARPADQGPGLSLAVTASSSASSDFPPEEPTADRVPVREISSEEGNRLLRIVRRDSGSVVSRTGSAT